MTIKHKKKILPVIFIFIVVLIFSAYVPKNQNNSHSFLKTIGSQKLSNSEYCNNLNTEKEGAYFSGIYPDLFTQLLGKSKDEVKAKIDNAFNQLFYGNDSSQRVYYPVEPDMAYIKDINNNDVRSEGMSYGMMIALQLNKKDEFDRLWKWAKTFMQNKTGPRTNYFAWHNRTNGEVIDSNSASDGEEWFVMGLFFASARWGNGEGIFNYKVEAQKILDAMLNKADSSDSPHVITNMFSKKEKQVVFVPIGNADDFTDPSYHLPHFYELWGRWADKDNKFWCEAASVSRSFLKKTVNPETGLAPDYAKFDGTPYNWFNRGNNDFRFDAWRVAMNIAIDYEWFAKEKWEVTQSDKLLNFFYSQGVSRYGNQYLLNGKELGEDHSTGLVAMNAVAALAATFDKRNEFVQQLWDVEIPNGLYRYYDGMLYMLGLLQVSGNFRIYNLTNKITVDCPD
jgi:oligosaccharide reducing-end xylanase